MLVFMLRLRLGRARGAARCARVLSKHRRTNHKTRAQHEACHLFHLDSPC